MYLVLGEAPADGTGLLGAEVEGEQLLLLVRLTQRRFLLLRDHRQHARDRGAHHLAAKSKRAGFNSIQPGSQAKKGRHEEILQVRTSWRACWVPRR